MDDTVVMVLVFPLVWLSQRGEGSTLHNGTARLECVLCSVRTTQKISVTVLNLLASDFVPCRVNQLPPSPVLRTHLISALASKDGSDSFKLQTKSRIARSQPCQHPRPPDTSGFPDPVWLQEHDIQVARKLTLEYLPADLFSDARISPFAQGAFHRLYCLSSDHTTA